ncbi:hypothetical protein Adt_42149 [Abeliophyllum distichum]|uniref:Aminotransferase-like plant mobile domain-containing protein n=1 Tax=Abeliophyllum distichum TaxID=126358 RepID=A0ABD1PSH0_9LAMI
MTVTCLPTRIEKQFFGLYKKLQTLRNNIGAEPTSFERVAFIHYWLCKFIICVLSIKPSIGYLPIYNELAYGQPLNLCSFLLATLYRGMATSKINLDHSLSLQRASVFESSVVFDSPIIHINEDPSSPEPFIQAFEQVQYPLPEGLAMVAYTPRSQYTNPMVVEYEEQVKATSALHSSSAAHPSTSSIFSDEDMTILKNVVLAYTSFMDKNISRASATSQEELLVCLIEDLAYALKCPILKLSTNTRLTLRGIHQEVSLLLSENMELRLRKQVSFRL